MPVFQIGKPQSGPPGSDTLRINTTTGIVHAHLYVIRFQDADTLQYVAYIPTLDISGYGENLKDATTMLQFSLEQFFVTLTALKPAQQKIELSKLGWKQNNFRTKEYSRMQVDVNGELKNFNVVTDSVEKINAGFLTL